MTAHPTNRESKRARKIGYVVGFMVNSIMLFIVNVRPGWRQLSFLTEDFAGILWLINLSMVSNATANLIYLWYDPAWFKSLCQVGISAIGLGAAIRMLRVFPFDFASYSFNWSALTRLLLALAILGSLVAIVTELVLLGNREISAAAGRSPYTGRSKKGRRIIRPSASGDPEDRQGALTTGFGPARGWERRQLPGPGLRPVRSSGVRAARVSLMEAGGLNWRRPNARNSV